MAKQESFVLESPTGLPLEGWIDYPDQPGPRPAVVICHGFKGFMEWGFFPSLAELLARRGFVAVRFNFGGSGMEPGMDRATRLDAFRENTFLREQEDLGAVLSGLGSSLAPGRVDLDRLGLFGHSRGGGGAILTAARKPWASRLKALVTWSAVAEFDRFGEDIQALWRREGVLPVVNARTGQTLELGVALLEELESHAGDLNILAAAEAGLAPWLIVHGENDETVPAAEAQTLASLAAGATQEGKERAELLLIPGASHTFGSRHPFQGPTSQLIEALNATQLWFRRHLS